MWRLLIVLWLLPATATGQSPDSVAWQRLFPLEVGDRWVYQREDRCSTPSEFCAEPRHSTEILEVMGDTLLAGRQLSLVEYQVLETGARGQCAVGFEPGDAWYSQVPAPQLCAVYGLGSPFYFPSWWILTANVPRVPDSISVGDTSYTVDAVRRFERPNIRLSFASDVGLFYLHINNNYPGTCGHCYRSSTWELIHARVGGIGYGAPLPSEPPPDSVAWERFFPAEVGDTWTYRFQSYATQSGWTDLSPLRVTVMGDSLVDGSRLPVFTVQLDTTTWTVVRGIREGDEWFTTMGNTGPWLLYQRVNPLAPLFVFTNDEGLAPTTISVGSSKESVDAVKAFSNGYGLTSVVQRFAADVGYYYQEYENRVGSQGGHWAQRLELSYARVGGVVYGTPVVDEPEPTDYDEASVVVAPNPARASARLTIALAHDGVVRVEVVDLLGRVVVARDLGEQPAGSSEHALDVSALAPGVYVLRATTNSGVVARRFVRAD